ncbi:sensor histidine kinase [Paenibacillus sp. WLX1005]|uniref:sensor histidine kinase n=1 Tax=Paenibacillus sp. WLX1005 TaxID=3243766 RepID=UPI003983E5F5
MSIRLRLTVWYSGILAVTLMLFSIAIYAFVYFNTYQDLSNRLTELFNNQISVSAGVPDENGSIDLLPSRKDYDRFIDAGLRFKLANYTDSSKNLTYNGSFLKVPDKNKIPEKLQEISYNERTYLVAYKPIRDRTDLQNVLGVLIIASDMTDSHQLFDNLRVTLIVGSLATLFIAFTLGLFLARKSMAPIGKVIKAANQIQNGKDLSVRIDYDGPADEIGQLISTVNGMFGRTEVFYKELAEAYTAQRRFVSDASHELRTPLTTIRGNVDLLQKAWNKKPHEAPHLDEVMLKQLSMEAINDISDEAKRMSRLVNDMLSLARADAGQTIMKDALPAGELLEEVVRRAQFIPHRADWQPDLSPQLHEYFVYGNKDYLQQMLFIFIENAFKYTPEGIVTLDTVLYPDQIGIRISDSGIGMDQEEVPHIFERFYRADESRGVTPGTGLGLSIAKWIIDAHEGSVEVVTAKGKGTTFVIWLPLAAVPVEGEILADKLPDGEEILEMKPDRDTRKPGRLDSKKKPEKQAQKNEKDDRKPDSPFST